MAKTAVKRPARKNKTARRKTARGKRKVAPRKKKKAAVARKTAAARKKKGTGKKKGKKKVARRGATTNVPAVQARLEKRVDKLAAQLEEIRKLVQKELAQDAENTRKYVDAETALQRRRVDQILDKLRQENQEFRSRLAKYLEENELLKGVTQGVADTAKALEERVRKIVSGEA